MKKGCEIVIKKYQRFGVKIGMGGTEGICENNFSFFSLSRGGSLVFEGTAEFAAGSSIRIDGGKFIIGNNFGCNKNCFFSCNESIVIGDDVLLGWNINVRDGDGHKIIYDIKQDSEWKPTKPISIGKHVWIGSYVDVLKGAHIADECVVGQRSLVNKPFTDSHQLLVGIPANAKKRGIRWEK